VLVIAFKMGLTLERKHGRGRDLARGAEKNIACCRQNISWCLCFQCNFAQLWYVM